MLLLETRLLLLWCLAIFGWVAHGGTDVAARPRAPQPLEAQPAPVRRKGAVSCARRVHHAARSRLTIQLPCRYTICPCVADAEIFLMPAESGTVQIKLRRSLAFACPARCCAADLLRVVAPCALATAAKVRPRAPGGRSFPAAL